MAQVSKYLLFAESVPRNSPKRAIPHHLSYQQTHSSLSAAIPVWVPCVQSGKKTRNYTIKMKDIVRYLERRETTPKNTNCPPAHIAGHTQSSPCFPNL